MIAVKAGVGGLEAFNNDFFERTSSRCREWKCLGRGLRQHLVNLYRNLTDVLDDCAHDSGILYREKRGLQFSLRLLLYKCFHNAYVLGRVGVPITLLLRLVGLLSAFLLHLG